MIILKLDLIPISKKTDNEENKLSLQRKSLKKITLITINKLLDFIRIVLASYMWRHILCPIQNRYNTSNSRNRH